MKKLFFAIAFSCVFFLVGCDKTVSMPEVNEKNCETENIKKIKDKNTRQEFAGLCLRR